MTSEALINKLLRVNSSWTRVELLSEIDIVQNKILEKVKPSMRIYDSSTGTDPVLTTIPGVFVYELTAASSFGYDVREVRNIKSSDGEELLRTYNGYGRYGEDTEIKTIKAVGGSKAKIIFSYDPGGADFYIECYKSHQKLVSENIELSIPDEFVFTALMEGVVGRIEQYEHGFGASKAWYNFENVTLPALTYSLETEVGNIITRTSLNKQQRND